MPAMAGVQVASTFLVPEYPSLQDLRQPLHTWRCSSAYGVGDGPSDLVFHYIALETRYATIEAFHTILAHPRCPYILVEYVKLGGVGSISKYDYCYSQIEVVVVLRSSFSMTVEAETNTAV